MLWFLCFVENMNFYIATGNQTNDPTIVPTGELLEEINLYWSILYTFKTPPDDGSLLQAKFEVFLDANPGNTTALNMANFQDIRSSLIKDKGSSALWFYPAAGSTILALVLMSLIKGLPRDKWEWGIITSRFLIGSGTCVLGILDIGASAPVFDSAGNRTTSKIWILMVGDSHLLLIIMAMILAVLLVIENLIAYAANRSYNSFDSINFLDGPERRRTRRRARINRLFSGGQTEDTMVPGQTYEYSDSKEQGALYTDVYNPYHGVETSENALNLQDGAERRRRARFDDTDEAGDVVEPLQQGSAYPDLYDPYHGSETAENTLYSRGGQ